jgi:hypothetical protein
VGTVNVGSRGPMCPPFNVALRERGSTAIRQAPPIRVQIGLVSQCRDHIPNKLNLAL